MVSFKIQKFEYLESGTQLFYEIKKILICASDTHFDKLRFVAEVTFKEIKR